MERRIQVIIEEREKRRNADIANNITLNMLQDWNSLSVNCTWRGTFIMERHIQIRREKRDMHNADIANNIMHIVVNMLQDWNSHPVNRTRRDAFK